MHADLDGDHAEVAQLGRFDVEHLLGAAHEAEPAGSLAARQLGLVQDILVADHRDEHLGKTGRHPVKSPVSHLHGHSVGQQTNL